MPVEKINSVNTIQQTKHKNSSTAPQKAETKKNGNALLIASLSALALATVVGVRIYKKKSNPIQIKKEDIDNIVDSVIKDMKFGYSKKGKAYTEDGILFTGTIERLSNSGNKMVTRYEKGDIIERTYTNINKQNPIAEINKLYNHDIKDIKMVDTKTTYKTGEVVTDFEVIEKNKNFYSKEIENVIKKSNFDKRIDENALTIYPKKEGTVSTTWDLGNGLILKETRTKEGFVRKLSQNDNVIRRIIDTPLGKIKQFKNSDGISIQIHENLGFKHVKTTMPDGTTNEYIGRNLEEMRGIKKM